MKRASVVLLVAAVRVLSAQEALEPQTFSLTSEVVGQVRQKTDHLAAWLQQARQPTAPDITAVGGERRDEHASSVDPNVLKTVTTVHDRLRQALSDASRPTSAREKIGEIERTLKLLNDRLTAFDALLMDGGRTPKTINSLQKEADSVLRVASSLSALSKDQVTSLGVMAKHLCNTPEGPLYEHASRVLLRYGGLEDQPDDEFNAQTFQRDHRRLVLVSTVYPNCASGAGETYKSVAVNLSKASDAKPNLRPVMALTSRGLEVLPGAARDLAEGSLELVVGSRPVPAGFVGLFASAGASPFHIQVYELENGCRKYSSDPHPDILDIVLGPEPSKGHIANGITVGPPKIYDSYLLRVKLSNAAAQLANLTPWNATAITNAYGAIQGITRDTSYLAAQAQTAPVPQIVTTANGPLNPNAAPTQTQQITVTPTCPPGYAPTAFTLPTSSGNGSITCAPITPQNPGGPISMQSTTLTSPSPATLQTVTTQAAQSPTLPSAPSSTALSLPSAISTTYSPADILAEEVKLNAQLEMYQTLLQGAQSDQLLIKNSRAISNRAQTTLGFSIYLTPPRQFHHAVAEVRIMLIPPDGGRRGSQAAPVSVVNLLPTQKTYNVAKITSHQSQFGAGAVIEQVVNAGVNTGRSKDRLYLAKESDTLSLQYPTGDALKLGNPLPEKIWEGLRTVARFQSFADCASLPPPYDGANPEQRLAIERDTLMFGWQFRPVLGADYVTNGNREVFAQLALPEPASEADFVPEVWVQTLWREYDVKRQAVGPVFHGTCSWSQVPDSISIITPLKVKDVTVDDVGGGIVKVQAKGAFFEPGVTVMTAGTNIPPVSFDGKTVQFFAPARDLLQNGSISLVGEGGRPVPIAIPVRVPDPQACNIQDAKLAVTPYPDGTSAGILTLTYGNKHINGNDLHPLMLIGSDVYGLRDKPLTPKDCDASKFQCSYIFSAPTDSLRSNRHFLIRDIAWGGPGKTGLISFGPSFAAMAPLAAPQPAVAPLLTSTLTTKNSNQLWTVGSVPVQIVSDTKFQPPDPSAFPAGVNLNVDGTLNNDHSITASRISAPDVPVPKPVWYAISGFGFEKLDPKQLQQIAAPDGASTALSALAVLSDTSAIIKFDSEPKSVKSVKLIWTPAGDFVSADSKPVAWDLAVPSTAPAAGISPAFAILARGDGRTIVFKGADFSTVNSVQFDGTPISGFQATSSEIDITVPASLTATPGYKEIVATGADAKGKPKQFRLPILVLPMETLPGWPGQ